VGTLPPGSTIWLTTTNTTTTIVGRQHVPAL
jgi:hypothetical protein